MKVVGAGTAFGLASNGATARGDTENAGDETDAGDSSGYEIKNTVHEVRTLIGEPTHPDRPADFFYQPTGLHIEPGDVIQFVFETPDHTVTSYHPAFGMQRRMPTGVHPISSPVLGWDPKTLPDDLLMPPGENDDGDSADEDDVHGETTMLADSDDDEYEPKPDTWLSAFEKPGVYDLECAPHEAFGMAMRVVVGDETDTTFETSDTEELPEPRVGPVGLSRQVLTDPNLEPETIVREGRIEWLDLDANQQPETTAEPENENPLT